MRPRHVGKRHAGSTLAGQPHPTQPTRLQEQSSPIRNVHGSSAGLGLARRKQILI